MWLQTRNEPKTSELRDANKIQVFYFSSLFFSPRNHSLAIPQSTYSNPGSGIPISWSRWDDQLAGFQFGKNWNEGEILSFHRKRSRFEILTSSCLESSEARVNLFCRRLDSRAHVRLICCWIILFIEFLLWGRIAESPLWHFLLADDHVCRHPFS